MIRKLLAVAGLMASPASADISMEEAFKAWVSDRSMAPAAMVALDRDGTPLAVAGIEAGPNDPLPIGSISKTIVGTCVMHLSDQGRVTLEDTVGQHLGWTGAQGAVTLAQLLMHTSGFGPDATQTYRMFRMRDRPDRAAELVDEVSTRALAPTQGTHSYNNENYLVLEAVLRAVLGMDPTSYCLGNVPALAGLASLGQTEGFSGILFAGGFELSATDLARFFLDLQRRDDWPMVSIAGGVSYGPGIVIRSGRAGRDTLFHSGGYGEPFGPHFGALGVRLANGRAVGFVYSGLASDDDMRALNQILLDYVN